MALVRVWTDVGARKPVPLLAKIVEKDGVIFTIRYLSESDDKIWRYEEDEYEIDDESINSSVEGDEEIDVKSVSNSDSEDSDDDGSENDDDLSDDF